MLIANNNLKERIRATPKTTAVCPHCGGQVISKCGDFKIWHWAHKTKCPYATEPMTEWHLAWQELALQNNCDVEVRCGQHIADAKSLVSKDIFEFQHSSISRENILSRCQFHKNNGLKTSWIIDIHDRLKSNSNLQIAEQNDTNFKFKIYHYNFLKLPIGFNSLIGYKYQETCYFGKNELYPYYGNIYIDCGKIAIFKNGVITSTIEPNMVFKILCCVNKHISGGIGTFVSKEDVFT